MSRILLIRHGQASFGSEDYDRLNDVGARQSAALGAHLKATNRASSTTVTGTLRRQIDTARLALNVLGQAIIARSDPAFDEYRADEIIASYLPALMQQDPALCAAGNHVSSDRRIFQSQLSGCLTLWTRGASGHDGESWVEFSARVRRGLDSVVAGSGKEDTIAVITSGGVIATLVGLTLGVTPSEILKLNWGLFNASITELSYGRSGLAVVSFNEAGHLRLAGPEMVTLR